jgi:hypothetical protein
LASALAVATVPGVSAAHAALPDGRVYEQVSPVDKSGNEAGTSYGQAAYSAAAADGSAMTYSVTGPTGDVVRGLGLYSTAERTERGWRSRGTLPGPAPGTEVDLAAQNPSGLVSADARHYAFTAPGTFGPPNPGGPLGASAAIYVGGPDTPLKWLTQPQWALASPQPGNLVDGVNTMEVAGGSSDLSTTYFTYCGTLTEEDAPRSQGATTSGFYEYRGGVVRNAGVLPDGSVDSGGAAAAGESIRCGEGRTNAEAPYRPTNQVSVDGQRALFVSPAPSYSGTTDTAVRQLYVREEGRSRLASHENGSTAPAAAGITRLIAREAGSETNGAIRYTVANPEGTYVTFATTDVLAPGAPNDGAPKVYVYDVEGDTVQYAAGVSRDVRAVASDGAVVSVTDGELAIWRDGTSTTVANVGMTEGGAEQLRTNADATALVLTSSEPLDPAHPDTGGTSQVYRWAEGDSTPTCLSCESGATSQFAAMSSFTSRNRGDLSASGAIQPSLDARGATADLSMVFFQTSASLAPEDTNGVNDVYSWKDGRVSLISAGTGSSPSYYLDSSASGRDVFFTTVDGLDPADTDGSYDIYDARVGGGFPGVTERATCEGDACQPPSNGPVGAPPVGSTAPGTGNVRPAAEPSAKRVRASKAIGRGGRVTLRVAAPTAGRITVSGSGLRQARRTVAKAGSYALKAQLTTKAKRAIAKAGRRRIRVKVAFRPASGRTTTTSLVVTVRK